MALNLSTLTSPATSGDVLAEALTTADFLEPVPVLRNLARGSQKGGDGKQGTALNQPRALPLDANGKGYLYLSGVSGNYASVPNAANLNGITDFVMEAKDVYIADWTTGAEVFFSKLSSGNEAFVFRNNSGNINIFALYGGAGTNSIFAHGLTGAATVSVRVTRVGTSLTAELDTGSGYVSIGTTQTVPSAAIDTTTTPLEIGAYFGGSSGILRGKIGRAVIWNNATASGTPVLDVDFTATNVRHGDTKFKCATGQVVTVNQSGNDPATIIKKPVLRFDGVNDGLQGLFANNLNSGYMFAAFSVLGDGGEAWGRVFSTNSSSGGEDDREPGAAFSIRSSSTTDLHTRFKLATASLVHVAMFDDGNGDILHESKIQNGSQSSKVNNANLKNESHTITTASDKFNIGSYINPSLANTAIDLEFLALFPSSITDDQADSVRNYINTRNLVFDLKDGFGYYFYDATKAPVGAISSGANAWSGRIVGSDNGDSASIEATQPTANDQPVSDGYVVNFADNSDHLDIPSISQAGYQIVGTSLGTFVYRVDNDAVTELNLLGNFGNASVRRAGDLYGVMLLPLSASSADIESAKRLLIDRGAAESATASNYYASWYGRVDIVEFGQADTSNITAIGYAWFGCNNMTKFPPLDLSSCVDFDSAWRFASSLSSFPAGAKLGTAASNVNFTRAWQSSGLTSFPALDLSTGSNFNSAFNGCTALTSFPSGAKLGTASTNVNFSSAWQSSGLTSFPALDLSTGTIFTNTFRSSALTSFGGCDLSKGVSFKNFFYLCLNLTEISADAKFGTAAVNVDFDSAFNSTGLTAFPALDLSNGRYFAFTFQNCTSLIDFSPRVFNNWNPGIINSGVFDNSWVGCSALSAVSVGNILQSISASGQYATVDGNSGSAAIADAGIDISYNTATGSLSAATNTAVTSLKAKGWSIIVNNVTL